MRLPRVSIPAPGGELPLWPPLLATRGTGSRSELHAHHAMHLVLALAGELRVQAGPRQPFRPAAGVLTAPDRAHAIDARGAEVLLVFLDPESDAGAALRALVDVQGGAQPAAALRRLTAGERDRLVAAPASLDPAALMREGGAAFVARAVAALGGSPLPPERPLHPRVRRLLRLLRAGGDGDTSLEGLATTVGLSSGRLMHVFTQSIGIPLRPYLGWLRLQRAAGAIVAGAAMAEAAHAAGFADAAHMTRTFRRMFGVAPSSLRPPRV